MDLRESIRNQTDVALKITKHVMFNAAKSSNLVLSPPSIHIILCMITAGSTGKTRDLQMLSFMNSTSAEDLNAFCSHLVSVLFADGSQSSNGGGVGPKLLFANGVWIDKSLTFIPFFKQVLDSAYKASSSQVDFQNKAEEAVIEVNLWVEKATCGLIKNVLSKESISASTALIFANAVYYKGDWADKFDPSKTKDGDFHLLNGRSVQAPFMTSKNDQLLRVFDGFKVLGLPYKKGSDGRQFSMYFFLPDAKDGLSLMVEKLTSDPSFPEHHLPYPYGEVEVGDFKIPKFKFSFGFKVSGVLKALGLVLPFSGEEAGMTEMVNEPLFVSEIFHKSLIEVNEEGTEAAAVTIMVCSKICSQVTTRPIDFVADHPFMFMIREDLTGAVLFIGHILNPLEES